MHPQNLNKLHNTLLNNKYSPKIVEISYVANMMKAKI